MKTPKGYHVVLVRFDGHFYLMAHPSGIIHAFTSRARALAHFRPYTEATRYGSHERAMSACIHSLFFAPVVVTATQEWMQQHVDTNEEGKFAVASLRTVAGSMYGVLMRPEVEAVYNEGTHPELVHA